MLEYQLMYEMIKVHPKQKPKPIELSDKNSIAKLIHSYVNENKDYLWKRVNYILLKKVINEWESIRQPQISHQWLRDFIFKILRDDVIGLANPSTLVLEHEKLTKQFDKYKKQVKTSKLSLKEKISKLQERASSYEKIANNFYKQVCKTNKQTHKPSEVMMKNTINYLKTEIIKREDKIALFKLAYFHEIRGKEELMVHHQRQINILKEKIVIVCQRFLKETERKKQNGKMNEKVVIEMLKRAEKQMKNEAQRQNKQKQNILKEYGKQMKKCQQYKTELEIVERELKEKENLLLELQKQNERKNIKQKNLQQEIIKLKEEKQLLVAKNKTIQQNTCQLNQKLTCLNEEVEKITKEKEIITVQCSELVQQLRQLTQKYQEIKKELYEVKEVINCLKNEMIELKESNEEIGKMNDELRQSGQKKENEIIYLKDKMQNSEKVKERQIILLKGQIQRKDRMKEQINKLKTQMETKDKMKEEQMKQLKREMETKDQIKEKQISLLKAQIETKDEAKERQIIELKDQIESKNQIKLKQIIELKGQMEVKDKIKEEQIIQLKVQIESKETLINELEVKLTALERKENLKRKLKVSQEVSLQIKQKRKFVQAGFLEQKNKEIQTKTQKINQLQGIIYQYNMCISTTFDSCFNLYSSILPELQEKKCEVKVLESLLQKKSQHINTLQNKLEQVKMNYRICMNEYTETSKRLNLIENINTSLQTQIDSLKDCSKCVQLLRRVEDLEKTNEELEQTIEYANSLFAAKSNSPEKSFESQTNPNSEADLSTINMSREGVDRSTVARYLLQFIDKDTKEEKKLSVLTTLCDTLKIEGEEYHKVEEYMRKYKVASKFGAKETVPNISQKLYQFFTE